jgi:hypothetical protein
MIEDALRETITDAIRAETEGNLTDRLAEVRREHEAKIKAKVDKALSAIRGKDKSKPKVKKPRKPRADKGTKRLGRGLPKVPTETKPKEPEL